jgi:signal transduction histidine kinase
MAEASPAEGDAAAGSAYMRQLCHELRQPLVVAVGYISMLEDGSFGELPAEAGKVLQTIAERLDAMNAIIEGMAGGGGQLDGG